MNVRRYRPALGGLAALVVAGVLTGCAEHSTRQALATVRAAFPAAPAPAVAAAASVETATAQPVPEARARVEQAIEALRCRHEGTAAHIIVELQRNADLTASQQMALHELMCAVQQQLADRVAAGHVDAGAEARRLRNSLTVR